MTDRGAALRRKNSFPIYIYIYIYISWRDSSPFASKNKVSRFVRFAMDELKLLGTLLVRNYVATLVFRGWLALLTTSRYNGAGVGSDVAPSPSSSAFLRTRIRGHALLESGRTVTAVYS